MRLRQALFVLMCSGLVAMPALAGQHGHHPTPTPTAPHATPDHDSAAAHAAPVTVSARITANPALVARLQPLLPSGTTLAAAATGFKNQGQFIAALHVAQNLHIPFASLKTAMTGPDHDSLGQAIHELQPTANAKAAAKTAEHEAAADLKATKPAEDRDKADR
jgi:hypothetical protein